MLRTGGWAVCAITTPAALAWVDVEALTKATGHPVRTEFRSPDDAEFAPRGDAVLVAPASFNTINKCAAGINDNLALGLINEALGSPSIPIALLPWVNGSLNDHPAYQPGLARLRDAGARIIVPSSKDLEAFDQACVAAGNWLKLAGSDSAPPSS
jgi:phosphopantothenoylcysteine synthetase/decarboxylase